MLVSNKEKMGVTFEGSKGTIYVDRGKLEADPKSLLDSQIGPSEIHLYKSDDHFKNFIDCVISRQPTASPVEVAHRSITICHLGNIAMRLGRETLRWDPRTEQIIGDDEAAKMLGRPYRRRGTCRKCDPDCVLLDLKEGNPWIARNSRSLV